MWLGYEGFEPRNAGIRIRCLTAWRYPNWCTYDVSVLNNWLGYEDSNLGMPESESGALPLGDTPTNWFFNLPNVFDTSEFGGYDRTSTCDPIIMSDVLNQLSYAARLFLRWLGYLDQTRECRYQNRCLTAWRYPNNRAVNRLLEEDGWGTWIRTRECRYQNRCLPLGDTPSVQRFLVNGAGGET